MVLSWNLFARLGLVLIAASSLARSQDIHVEEGAISSKRLPKNIVPKHYDLEFVLPMCRGFRTVSGRYASGQVNITLKVLPISSNEEDPRRIILNKGNNVRVDENSFKFFKLADGLEIPLEILKLRKDDNKHLIELQLDKELEAGSIYCLEIKFFTYLEDMRGLHRQGQGDRNKYFATEFEPANAHGAFPCFDEPQFKATFNLRIVHAYYESVLSNTPMISVAPLYRYLSASTQTIFAKTPPMSTHMLGFVVGPKFDFIERPNVGLNKIPVRIYLNGLFKDRAEYALDVASKSLEWMEKYTEIAYPLKKFDLVIVNEHIRQSSEYWGLSILRPCVSLIDDLMSPDLPFKIALHVAHVVAHQWFGNLITTKWWDSLWITEMLASQKAFQIVRELYPEYNSNLMERHLTLYDAIELDTQQQHHLALSANPEELDEFSNEFYDQLFDNVTFMKSASFGQLLQNYVGAEKFAEASRDMLRFHQFSNVDWSDFAESLGLRKDEKQEYLKRFSSQLHESSYPIINLSSDEIQNEIFLDLANVQANELKLSAIFGDISGKHRTITLSVNLDKRELDLPEWFSLRNDQHYFKLNPEPDISTYFLVNYSPPLIKLNLKKAIQEKHLSELDRLNVLDDAIELLKVKAIEASTLRQLIECFKDEDSLKVIMAIARAGDLFCRELGTKIEIVKKVLDRVYNNHGFNALGSMLDQYAQTAVLGWLIKVRDKRVIKAALDKFDQEVPLNNFRRLIHKVVEDHGDSKQKEKLSDRLTIQRIRPEKRAF